MQLLKCINDFSNIEACGIGLGNFDGLHIGHMVLINTLISECNYEGLNSLVYTFDRNTVSVTKKGILKQTITTNDKRVEILGRTPLDFLYFENFTEEFSKLSPNDFVKNILVGKLNMKLVVIGFDYRFGYKGSGDAKLMEKLGKEYGFRTIVIPPIKIESITVSSTQIREFIKQGNMKKAFEFLGRHFSMSGCVEKGRQLGRTIGFPTANFKPGEDMLFPKEGVYVTKTKIGGKWHRSISNVGRNPTVGHLKEPSIETFIFDFNEDIYGVEIEVAFFDIIREEKKFKSLEILKEQIIEDYKFAEIFFEV